MSDDTCRCDHLMMDHREFGCEECMCEAFQWPTHKDVEGTI